MKSTNTTFEQAKALKEKGFDVPVNQFYYSEEFKTKDIKLNVDLLNHNEHISKYSAPEQHIVVEWLWLNHGIWIDVTLSSNSKFLNLIRDIKNPSLHLGIGRVNNSSFFDTPQAAYSAAFDYIKDNNLI